jgi:hypothetical protein
MENVVNPLRSRRRVGEPDLGKDGAAGHDVFISQMSVLHLED